jgi:hypothetical protein
VRASLRAGKTPRKVLAQQIQAWAPSPSQDSDAPATATQAAPWGQAMDAVLLNLLATDLRDTPRLCVVMADPCAHVDVVKGDFSCSSDRQLDAIANACIAEIQGDNAAKQVVRWQLQEDHQHLLISSIAEKDVATLLEVASTHRLKVQSIQPDFFVQWNAYASAQAASHGVFASVNEGYATVAFATQGIITALSCGPCNDADAPARAAQPMVHQVDERTHRLLSSIGQAFNDVPSFVLVTPDPERVPGDSRWTPMRLREDSP